MAPEELADELHNCHLDAWRHPDNKSGDDWNCYRLEIARELLERLDIEKKK